MVRNYNNSVLLLQVGNLEDSNVYIRMKSKAASEVHITVKHIKLPRNVCQILLHGILTIHTCSYKYGQGKKNIFPWIKQYS